MAKRLKAHGIMSDRTHRRCSEQKSSKKGTDLQHLSQKEGSTATSDQQIAVQEAESTYARLKKRKRKHFQSSKGDNVHAKIPKRKKTGKSSKQPRQHEQEDEVTEEEDNRKMPGNR